MTQSRKRFSGLSLFVLGLFAGTFFLRFGGAGAGPTLIGGAHDQRGFRVHSVDAGTKQAVRYNPCAPIHYVINPALAPPQGVADVHRAIQLTSEASGLDFVYDGTTDEPDSGVNRPAYQPERYGDRWAPILISWTERLSASSAVHPDGRRPIAAGGSHYEVNGDGVAVYVTGSAVFDVAAIDLKEGFGGETWGQVMLHELGHVLGLDHVEDASSVMNPVLGLRAASWGTGDRAGLWTQGIGSSCLSPPPSP